MMKRPEPDSAEAQRRSAAAAEWLVRRDRGLSGAEQDEFLQWLAADPRHGEWLALHRGVMADYTALATWRPEHSAEPNPDLLAPPRRRSVRLVPFFLAAAAVALALAWWRLVPGGGQEAVAASAELKRCILEDGSSVEYQRDAVVQTAYNPRERRAAVVRGEAYFAVAPDRSRPFVVVASGVEVQAVGTEFGVRIDGATIDVVVTEGRVRVRRVSGAGTTTDGVQLDAGQRVTVALRSDAPPQVVPVSRQTIAHHLNAQPHVFDFSSAPLGVAVAEFNRRNRVQFILADATIAALPIVASIRSDNTEGFAAFLAETPSLQIERRSPTEIVIRRR